jgi:hypothetical protein
VTLVTQRVLMDTLGKREGVREECDTKVWSSVRKLRTLQCVKVEDFVLPLKTFRFGCSGSILWKLSDFRLSGEVLRGKHAESLSGETILQW